MLMLIAAVVLGILLYRNSPRLEGASDPAPDQSVRAYVDGKPVDSYVQE